MMKLAGQHILSSDQFDLDTLTELFRIADLLTPVAQGKMACDVLDGALMGSLFFEASTRTRLSFDAAFMRLGGRVSSTTGVSFSSIVKGESITDTARVIGGYFDVLVVRHPEESAIFEMAQATHCPLINGGNGAGEHPTQALLDLYTLRNEYQRIGKTIDHSTICMVGDLRYGRTVHSLVRLLSLYQNITFYFVSPPFLKMPTSLINLAQERGHRVIETDQLIPALNLADLVYATRVQKERFAEVEGEYAYSVDYRINADLINQHAKHDLVIMHPLPRDSREGANDLAADLDSDKRLAIFRQSDAGVPARMALFTSILGVNQHIESRLRSGHWFIPARRIAEC